jgi:hypothetical protein
MSKWAKPFGWIKDVNLGKTPNTLDKTSEQPIIEYAQLTHSVFAYRGKTVTAE